MYRYLSVEYIGEGIFENHSNGNEWERNKGRMTLSSVVIFTPMGIKSIPLESPALAEFKYIICFPTAALVVEKMTYF